MAKFGLRAAVRKAGEKVVRSVHEIREEPDTEPMYSVQIGRDFATRVWAKQNELEAVSPKADDVVYYPDGRSVRIFCVNHDGSVDISPDRRDPPIGSEHFAPTGEPNTWELVGVSSSDFSRY